MEEVIDEFDSTLNWAVEEEKLRLTRTEGVGTFYLVIASFIVLVICFFVLIYANKGRVYEETTTSPNALEMMQDENNIYDIESEYEEVEDDVDGEHVVNLPVEEEEA